MIITIHPEQQQCKVDGLLICLILEENRNPSEPEPLLFSSVLYSIAQNRCKITSKPENDYYNACTAAAMLGEWGLDLLKAFTLSQPAECSAGDLLISAHFLSASGAAVTPPPARFEPIFSVTRKFDPRSC